MFYVRQLPWQSRQLPYSKSRVSFWPFQFVFKMETLHRLVVTTTSFLEAPWSRACSTDLSTCRGGIAHRTFRLHRMLCLPRQHTALDIRCSLISLKHKSLRSSVKRHILSCSTQAHQRVPSIRRAHNRPQPITGIVYRDVRFPVPIVVRCHGLPCRSAPNLIGKGSI